MEHKVKGGWQKICLREHLIKLNLKLLRYHKQQCFRNLFLPIQKQLHLLKRNGNQVTIHIASANLGFGMGDAIVRNNSPEKIDCFLTRNSVAFCRWSKPFDGAPNQNKIFKRLLFSSDEN